MGNGMDSVFRDCFRTLASSGSGSSWSSSRSSTGVNAAAHRRGVSRREPHEVAPRRNGRTAQLPPPPLPPPLLRVPEVRFETATAAGAAAAASMAPPDISLDVLRCDAGPITRHVRTPERTRPPPTRSQPKDPLPSSLFRASKKTQSTPSGL